MCTVLNCDLTTRLGSSFLSFCPLPPSPSFPPSLPLVPPSLPPSLPPPLPTSPRGAEVIQQQIDDREQQRLLDEERKDQETQAMLHYLERLQQEDMEALQRKRQAQKNLMEEVAKCNDVRIFQEGKFKPITLFPVSTPLQFFFQFVKESW